ncbi:hypothetical protein TRFO_13641 [Tritrichomonas foetus]|uniref:Uncharacterized protein n=1 Tax=Tritrichomonas foetus TaxID=1144522 RepID=A0A1J4KXH6_9EUKA|nr:hypothetical protein TRFO_13641 [Tritrichomonas foetus]|eukprot:OHT15955.1 hypothetical protein TRFO_13641 [Tritrichomonas foetus]
MKESKEIQDTVPVVPVTPKRKRVKKVKSKPVEASSSPLEPISPIDKIVDTELLVPYAEENTTATSVKKKVKKIKRKQRLNTELNEVDQSMIKDDLLQDENSPWKERKEIATARKKNRAPI